MRWLMPIAAALLAGCYTYQPMDRVHPPASGTLVRVRLAPNAMDTLDSRLRQVTNQGSLVLGRLMSFTPETLTLNTWGARSSDVRTVGIPSAMVSQVELKRFAPRRTAVLLAVGAGIVTAIAVDQFRSASGGGSRYPDGPPGPGGALISTFRLRAFARGAALRR